MLRSSALAVLADSALQRRLVRYATTANLGNELRKVPGLIRKQFIDAEDGSAGGVHLRETRAAAEEFYAGPWLDGIRGRYGVD